MGLKCPSPVCPKCFLEKLAIINISAAAFPQTFRTRSRNFSTEGKDEEEEEGSVEEAMGITLAEDMLTPWHLPRLSNSLK